MAISNTVIGTSPTPIFSSSGNSAITTIIVCNVNSYDPMNPTTGQATLKLYAVPAADVSGGVMPKHLIVNGLELPAGETFTFDNEKMILSNGDYIYAVANNANTLVSTVSSLGV